MHFETVAVDVIQVIALGLHFVFNKDVVMILPDGINNAAGLKRALLETGFSPVNTVAVGDAENDKVMLWLCGSPTAVDNSFHPDHDLADIVLQKLRGVGVEQLIDMIQGNNLSHVSELEMIERMQSLSPNQGRQHVVNKTDRRFKPKWYKLILQE